MCILLITIATFHFQPTDTDHIDRRFRPISISKPHFTITFHSKYIKFFFHLNKVHFEFTCKHKLDINGGKNNTRVFFFFKNPIAFKISFQDFN